MSRDSDHARAAIIRIHYERIADIHQEIAEIDEALQGDMEPGFPQLLRNTRSSLVHELEVVQELIDAAE